MKRTISAGIVLLLLLFIVTASAAPPGSSANPLISLSELEGKIAESLKSDISQALGSAADISMNKLDELYREYAGFDFNPRFTRIPLAVGDTVTLSMGSSFILLSGSGTLSKVSGTVINVSTGETVVAGNRLAQYQRYFCAENSSAVITANSASTGQVDGYYIVDYAAPNRQHPVFRDVMEKDWYYAAVDFVYNNNLFGGTTPNTFSPAVSMTRGMFVTVLYRLEGEPTVGSGGQFSDVRNTSLYYYDAVTWANASNVVLGYSNGAFGPDDPVTIEQMATIIYRYAEYKQRDMIESGSAYNSFPDRGDVSGYAATAMSWTVSKGIINGANGRLLPRNTATRAEVAQIIMNYVTIIR